MKTLLLSWVRVATIKRRSRGPPQHPLGEGRRHVLHILALTSPNCTRYQFFFFFFFHFMCLLFTFCYLNFTNQCEAWASLHFLMCFIWWFFLADRLIWRWLQWGVYWVKGIRWYAIAVFITCIQSLYCTFVICLLQHDANGFGSSNVSRSI